MTSMHSAHICAKYMQKYAKYMQKYVRYKHYVIFLDKKSKILKNALKTRPTYPLRVGRV